MPIEGSHSVGHRHRGRLPTSPRHNLPAQPASIIGRDKDIKAICDYVLRREVRLLTLVGAPGIGKTRLSLAAAEELLKEHPDGAWFVDLAPISTPTLVSATIAGTLGLQEGGEETLDRRLQRLLKDKQILLVLDNFEQVLAAARDISGLLEACPSVRILVTSREALHLRWERQYSVPPLEVPESQHRDPKVLAEASSVILFVESARAVKPQFALTAENAGDVAEICGRLEGLPLAIELAARQTDVRTPHEILVGLRRSGLDLLTDSPKDVPGRHGTLRTAISWSNDLLQPDEQRFFRRLAVFAGGCTLAAAEEVCHLPHETPTDLRATITSLVRKNLLQREEGTTEPRFRMLEMIREYAVEQLEKSGEETILRHRHQDWAVRLVEEAATKLWGAEQVEYLGRLDAEHNNLRSALAWADTSSDSATIYRLVRTLWWFWYLRGHLSEGSGWVKIALEQLATQTPERAEALVGAGWLTYGRSNLVRAGALLEESLGISREIGDKLGMVRALMPLVFVTRERGDTERARLLCEESVMLSREIGYRWGVAFSLYLLGTTVAQDGDFNRAAELYEEGLPLFRELGDRFGSAYSVQGLGRNAFAQEDYDRAAELYGECLALSRELGNKRGICFGLTGLGHVARRRGDYDQATSLYADALRRWHELGNTFYVAYLLDCVASMAAIRKQPERAVRLFGAGAALRESIGSLMPTARSMFDYDETIATLRRRFGVTRFNAAWEAGRALSAEAAVAEAFDFIEEVASKASGETGSRAASASSGPLTSREREVAILVAHGLTNRQIAGELVITEGTAASHVEHIRDKLGFHSRAQIAAWAIAQGIVPAPHA